MSTETNAAEIPANTPQPDAPAQDTAAPADTPQNSDQPDQQTETPAKDNDPVKLENALNRKKYEAKQLKNERNYWRRIAEERAQKPDQQQGDRRSNQQQPAAKTPEDFKTVEEWVRYEAKQIAEGALKDYEGRTKAERESQSREAYRAERGQEFAAKAEKLHEALPDFDQVIQENSDTPIQPHVMDALYPALGCGSTVRRSGCWIGRFFIWMIPPAASWKT